LGAVDREDSVEVVDFVLQEFRPITFQIHLYPVSLKILVSNPNAVRSRNSNQEVRE
jgi:hypothetical protein